MIVVAVVTSLDQNIALVPTLPRLFKREVHEIQKNCTDVIVTGTREREKERKREREKERDLRSLLVKSNRKINIQNYAWRSTRPRTSTQNKTCNPKSLMSSDHI